MQIATIGLDPAKYVFQVHGVGATGKVVVARRRVHVPEFSKKQSTCLVGMEACAGLRVSEVVKLRVKHIDASLGIIRVEQGKGRKDRHVMLSPEILVLLRERHRPTPAAIRIDTS